MSLYQKAYLLLRQLIKYSQGGIAAAAHPYNHLSKRINLFELQYLLDGIETINSPAWLFYIASRLATRTAEKLNLAKLGGSDSRLPCTIGDAYTEVERSNFALKEIYKSVKRWFNRSSR